MLKLEFSSFFRFGIILIFVFFIYSGSLKWVTIFPFDATIFFAIPLFLTIIVHLQVSDKPIYKPKLILIVSFISLFVWILITCLYTVSEEYYKDKLLRTLLIYLAFFFPIIYFKDYSYFKDFINSISAFATIVILMLTGVIIIYGNLEILFYATELESLNIPDYLIISEILGAFILLNHSRNGKLILLLKLIALFYMIMLGGRGPIIFLAIIYIFYYLFRTKLTFQKIILVVIIPFLFISSLSLFQEWEFSKIMFYRVSTLIEGDAFESRGELIQISTAIIKEKFLFGTGYGGFGMAAFGSDFRAYPHNIILEIFVETGIVGLLLILFFVVYFFARIFVRLNNNKQDVCTLDFSLCFIYLFLNAMKSSSFVDVRNLFGLMGIVIAYYAIEYKFKRTMN
jgi:O-antigen ligase